MRLAIVLVVPLAACTLDFDSFRRPSAPLSVGDDFACAIRPSGQVACWGGNDSGQLGSPNGFEATPVDVAGAIDAVVVVSGKRAQPVVPGENALSGHVCIIDEDAIARCFGDNRDGQLGLPADGARHPQPTAVPNLDPVISIDLGANHTCAVTTRGEVFCWGANVNGQLGTGDRNPSETPMRIDVGGRAVAVALGRYFSCALRTDGRVLCWGANDTSQIGDGTMTEHETPFLTSVANAIALDAGSHHACALLRGGALMCWGSNQYASLGTGAVGGTGPVTASAFTEAIDAFTIGGSQTCVRTLSGRQLCVGSNDTMQIGTPPTTDPVETPFELSIGPEDIVAGGGWSTCSMSPSRTVSCWGANWGGQLGDGTSGMGTNRPNPAPVVAFP